MITTDENVNQIINNIDTDLANITQEEFSAISRDLWNKFAKEIQSLLKEIEIQELKLKKEQNYIQQDSFKLASMLTKEIADFKTFEYLKNLMIKAYDLIHRFREYVTGENIEYFIQVWTGKKTAKYSQIQLKELINYLSLSVDSSKTFRLSLVPQQAKKIEATQSINAFRESLYEIQRIITNMKKAAGETVNQGFVLEAALNLIADKGPQVKVTSNLVQKYYKPGSLPGTRGGDINEKRTQKLIQRGMLQINKKLQIQAKKVSGSLGAAVVTITNIKNELFNLFVLLKEFLQGRVNKTQIKKYFKSTKRASDVTKLIEKELNMEVEKTLYETIEKYFKTI